ncbi:MAG: BatA domain-containing protein [Pirellulales bacterium]
MDTLTFLNSPLLWGLSLAAIPIIIHLLYRRQYRRVDWAPMRYLKLSIQRNRRRIRIEQLLLLLLRTALLLLLFFLVARPVMHAEGLSRWFGASGRTNRIVVLDDSLSIGYAAEGKTALARGQEVLADLLPTFGAKDAFTLVLASEPAEPVLREVELGNVDDVMAIIRGVKPTETLGAWDTILGAVDDLMASGSYPIYELTLVTDLRRAGWDERLDELGNRWAADRVRLRVFDVGIADTGNVALVGLEQSDRVALVATPTRFEAEITNDTGGRLAGLEANFIVDGKASLVRVPELNAGQSIKLPLTATFQEPGQHDVAFELAQDALVGDNRRTVAVDVRESITVELVDGEPSAEPLGGETDFLALALSLAGDAADAFRVEVLTDSEWASTPARDPDVLVLANVAQLSPEQVEIVEQQVAAGMGLMVFVGDGVDPDIYNQLLYKDGAGLLPAALVSVADGEFSGLLVEAGAGSPLDTLAQLTPAALQRVKVRKSYEIKLPTENADGVRVLARWNNQAAAPAVVEKIVGAGRVLIWTTAADRGWSDWPTEASYVLAVRETARAIARTDARFREFTAGQTLSVRVPASHNISLPAIEVPDGDEPQPLVVAAPTDKGPGQSSRLAELSYRDTRRAGLYRMTWRDSVSGAMSQQFAVNPDRRESNLERISVDDFRGLWGALAPEVISIGTQGDTSLAVRGREIWRTLATCMLGLLVFEACFARWAGRQR